MDFISIWGQAIAQFEGFNSPGSRPARNHNPGDLKYAGQPGAVGQDDKGFAIFPDDISGFTALSNQLNKYVRDFPGYSLLDITAHYLGQHAATADSQGNAFTYADYVAGQLGVGTDATLGDLSAGATSSSDGSGGPDASGILSIVAFGGLAFWLVSRLFG